MPTPSRQSETHAHGGSTPSSQAIDLARMIEARPGFAVVTGRDAAAAEAFFAVVERHLRRPGPLLHLSGRMLDPDAAGRALGSGMPQQRAHHSDPPAPSPAAPPDDRPPVVVVSDADASTAAELDHLRRAIERLPNALDVLRVVLLGGPKLLGTLRQPSARAVSSRVTTRMKVPESDPLATTIVTNGAPRMSVATAGAWLLAAAGASLVVLAALARTADEPAKVAVLEAPPKQAILEETSSTAAAPVTPSGTLALQVGSFRVATNAQTMRAQLAERFAHVTIATVERDGTTYHRVRVEGFETRAEREVAAATLREAGYTPIPAPPGS
jgi:hypothetical protein